MTQGNSDSNARVQIALDEAVRNGSEIGIQVEGRIARLRLDTPPVPPEHLPPLFMASMPAAICHNRMYDANTVDDDPVLPIANSIWDALGF